MKDKFSFRIQPEKPPGPGGCCTILGGERWGVGFFGTFLYSRKIMPGIFATFSGPAKLREFCVHLLPSRHQRVAPSAGRLRKVGHPKVGRPHIRALEGPLEVSFLPQESLLVEKDRSFAMGIPEES